LTDSQWSETIAKEPRNQLTDTERIDKLLKGFKKLNQIRRILKSHVESAQTLLDDYYKHKVKGKGHEQVLNAIMRLERQGNLVIDRSEQSLRDLLNFVFLNDSHTKINLANSLQVYVRVSIDEARRSTDIARSMRHLSWMTVCGTSYAVPGPANHCSLCFFQLCVLLLVSSFRLTELLLS
jgi:hypothetical protein